MLGFRPVCVLTAVNELDCPLASSTRKIKLIVTSYNLALKSCLGKKLSQSALHFRALDKQDLISVIKFLH